MRSLATFSALVMALWLSACGDDDGGGGDGGPTGDGGMTADGGGDVDGGPGSDGGPEADGGGVDSGPVEPTDPFDGIGAVEMVQGGFMFLEGPHWREADGVLLFTDIPDNSIQRLTPPDTIDVFESASGGANGLATFTDGRLLAAEHGGRRIAVYETDGSVSAFADAYMGDAFNSPNDLVVRSDGTVYFTDPPYGLGGRPREIAFDGVFRVDPSGTVVAEVEDMGDNRPNGIGLSPDESVLYVAFTNGGETRAYDVAADGSLSGERTFASDTPGADGMALDTMGNVYVTTSEGVKVYAPDGSSWGTIDVPMTPANCGFGGDDKRTLYITARTVLYSVSVTIPGL